ncbi:MAG: hypothetical protein HFG41_02730 [Coprococcus sp.]|nr:hypothetical protein [Coprococcus sp.]
MLEEYEQEMHTGMDIRATAELIYDYTSGYPYLVSYICKVVDERLSGQAVIANRIFETWFYNLFISEDALHSLRIIWILMAKNRDIS